MCVSGQFTSLVLNSSPPRALEGAPFSAAASSTQCVMQSHDPGIRDAWSWPGGALVKSSGALATASFPPGLSFHICKMRGLNRSVVPMLFSSESRKRRRKRQAAFRCQDLLFHQRSWAFILFYIADFHKKCCFGKKEVFCLKQKKER